MEFKTATDFVGAIATACLAIFAWKSWKESKDAGNHAREAAAQAKQIHDSQKLLAQRQLLVPLWQYICSMEEVKPEDLVEPDVKKALDVLELIAVCCEGGMVDELVIKRTFRQTFIHQYQQIERCGPVAYFSGKSGKTLLLESPAIQTFYNRLLQEHLEKDVLTKV